MSSSLLRPFVMIILLAAILPAAGAQEFRVPQNVGPSAQRLGFDPVRPSIALLSKSTQATHAHVKGTISPGSENDLLLSRSLRFTVQFAEPVPQSVQLQFEIAGSASHAVLMLGQSGGLVLRDARTVIATLDPLVSFGAAAFGPLRVRAVYPDQIAPRIHAEHEPPQMIQVGPGGEQTVTQLPDSSLDRYSSDWLSLGTVVRVPELTQIVCPAAGIRPCTLSGSNLDRIESLAADLRFTAPVQVPVNFMDRTIQIPHVTAGRLFLKLRDDPLTVDRADVPVSQHP